MRIQVEPGLMAFHRMPLPKQLLLNGRRIEIVEILDQWYGPDYRYVKMRDRNGALYILRYDEISTNWQLTMYMSVRAQTLLEVMDHVPKYDKRRST